MESIARGTAIPSCIDVSPSDVSYTEVAMMLRHSFSLEREAAAIEHAVDSALGSGMRTADIATRGERVISTHAMGEAIAAWVCQAAEQMQRSLRAEE